MKVNKFISLGLGAILATSVTWFGTAHAQRFEHFRVCNHDSIVRVEGNGSLLRLDSGNTFEVLDEDTMKSEFWAPGDDVLVCTSSFNGERSFSKITDFDVHGETVHARSLD